jgi:hypothetical protein
MLGKAVLLVVVLIVVAWMIGGVLRNRQRRR